jgi:SulP family sulfate permease
MAFAIASGMSPTAGIWTAIVAGFMISALGGSRVQIGGPTGAFIPIIYGIVVDYGVQNLLVATMLAGAMLVAMGVFRIGNLIRFIPKTVVIGFTNGIAVVIFLAQIKDFLGLQIDHMPGEFFGKVKALVTHLDTIDLPTVALSVASLVVLLSWNRLARRFPPSRRLPGPLGVLVLATAANAILQLPVETIGSRFNGIPQELPAFALPELSLATLGKLISPALTIALLGAIESLLSARVADAAIDDRHDPNQELIAQGLANLVAPLFGGFAATGAIARTATNVRTGGRTPVAGIVHALVLLAVVLVFAPSPATFPSPPCRPSSWWCRSTWANGTSSAASALLAALPHHPADHLPRHRALRPDPGRRARHGAGQPVLHLPHVRPHPRRAPAAAELSMMPGFLYPDGAPAWWPTRCMARCSSAPSTSSRPCSTRPRSTPRWSSSRCSTW